MRQHLYDPLRTASLVAVLAIAACVGTIAPAGATTSPALAIDVPVQVSSDRLSVRSDIRTLRGVARYRRGTIVHFHVRNLTKDIIRPQLRVLTGLSFIGGSRLSKITKDPASITPGHVGSFNVDLFFRGKLVFEAATNGKIVAAATIVVF